MGITNSNKTVSVSQIDCGDSFQVRLSLTAEPDIISNPTDIVLILDRSGSMEDSIDELKVGAKQFINIIYQSTGANPNGQIGFGSRIGVVSFADTATQDTQLITDVADLDAAVDALASNGSTNHADAFAKANALFQASSTNAKVMVMFTDGVTTAGPDPSPVAAAARAQGVTIYVIGLSGNGGIDVAALEDWASKPASSFVAITPDDAELEELFENLAKNITNPGATDIVIEDEVTSCFRITAVSAPTKGMASLVDATTVRWTIDELGTTASEGAVLEFTVQHRGLCAGTQAVNASISYDDAEGNVVTFPEPEITVDCGSEICPEPCPEPVELAVDGCADTLEFDAGELVLTSLGRIVELDVTLKNICPQRRVALAVILTEVDAAGVEYKRGLKTMTIPAHDQPSCRDVAVRCIRFVLPEDLDVSGTADSICNQRNFRARFIAHYIDNDFECCECSI